MYWKKIYDMGWIQQIEKCYPANYGAPGESRSEKKKATPEEIKKQNERNRWKKLQRIILANFGEGGWHLILKYRLGERPETYEEAKKQRKKFIDKMRDALKKAGIPFKWIAVTERGKKGQVLHHHMIIEDINTAGIVMVKLVKQLWTYGNVHFVSLYEDGEYEKLAEYLVKDETKEESSWATYSRSRNLIVPVAEKKVIRHRKWLREPKVPQGWYLVKDSLINGENKVTGLPYQHYTIKKLGRRESG